MSSETGKKRWWMTDVALCVFVASVLFQIAFRAKWAFMVDAQNDEGCYLATLSQLVDESTAGICIRRQFYMHAPGAPLLWVPAGLLSKVLRDLSGGLFHEWAIPAIAIWGFTFWGVALYAILRTLKAFLREQSWTIPRPAPALLATAILLNGPLLYYVMHFAVMPHSAQAMLAFLMVSFIYGRSFWAATTCAALLSLTRYNDAPAFLLLAGSLLDSGVLSRRDQIAKAFRRPAGLFAALCGAVALAWVGRIAFVTGYFHQTVWSILSSMRLSGLNRFLIDDRFGMIWIEPWWVLSLAMGVILSPWLSNLGRGAVAWLLLEAAIAVAWDGNGGDFGYRYLIGSYAGALVIWLESLKVLTPRWRAYFPRIAIVGAAWSFLLASFYKSIGALSPETKPIPDCANGLSLGVPQMALTTIQHLFDPAVYGMWLRQQLPAVTIYLSWFPQTDPELRRFRVPPESQVLLSFAVSASLGYILIYLYRKLSNRSSG